MVRKGLSLLNGKVNFSAYAQTDIIEYGTPLKILTRCAWEPPGRLSQTTSGLSIRTLGRPLANHRLGAPVLLQTLSSLSGSVKLVICVKSNKHQKNFLIKNWLQFSLKEQLGKLAF